MQDFTYTKFSFMMDLESLTPFTNDNLVDIEVGFTEYLKSKGIRIISIGWTHE
jgi:hypothetical protein